MKYASQTRREYLILLILCLTFFHFLLSDNLWTCVSLHFLHAWPCVHDSVDACKNHNSPENCEMEGSKLQLEPFVPIVNDGSVEIQFEQKAPEENILEKISSTCSHGVDSTAVHAETNIGKKEPNKPVEQHLTIETELLTLSKGNTSLGYRVPFFLKMVLNRAFPALGPVDRPPGTEFRPGDEVFLCPKNRPLAKGRTFIIVGFFLENKKHPDYASVVLLDEEASLTYRAHQSTNEELGQVFRVCPVKFVGHSPHGRHIDTTGTLLDSNIMLFQSFISNVALASSGLQAFDFLQMQVKSNPDGSKAGNVSRTRGKSKLPTTNQVKQQEVDSPLTSPSNKRGKLSNFETTPAYAKRIEKKLDVLLASRDPNKNMQQLTKLQTHVAKLLANNKALTSENNKLKSVQL